MELELDSLGPADLALASLEHLPPVEDLEGGVEVKSDHHDHLCLQSSLALKEPVCLGSSRPAPLTTRCRQDTQTLIQISFVTSYI